MLQDSDPMPLHVVWAGSYLSEVDNPGSLLLQPKIYFYFFSSIRCSVSSKENNLIAQGWKPLWTIRHGKWNRQLPLLWIFYNSLTIQAMSFTIFSTFHISHFSFFSIYVLFFTMSLLLKQDHSEKPKLNTKIPTKTRNWESKQYFCKNCFLNSVLHSV